MTFNYGLIGCGVAGKVHCYYFSKHPSINFISITDTNPDAIKQFDILFNPQNSYLDYKTMFNKEKLDAISICTPPNLHAEQAIAAAKQGIHILCEKPLATTLKDAQNMVQICKQAGVVFGVMLPRRFYNNSRSVKEALENNLLGKIEQVEFSLECNKPKEYYATWRGKKQFTGGGILMSQAIHSIDQLVYFFGKPTRVQGKVKTTRGYIEVEDEAEAKIEFENGIKVALSATANSDKTWQGITRINGEKGKIMLNSAETPIWQVPGMQSPKPEEKEPISTELKPIYYGPGHLKVINDFIAAIQKGRKPFVTGKDSLAAMRAILGIYKSSEEGGRIIDLDELDS